MLLKKGETALKQQEKVEVEIEHAESGAKQGVAKGTFFLTDQRIVFDAVTGMFSKKTTTIIDCQLANVVNVSIEGMFGKKLVLQFPMRTSDGFKMAGGGLQEVTVKGKFNVSEPLEWERVIRKAIAG